MPRLIARQSFRLLRLRSSPGLCHLLQDVKKVGSEVSQPFWEVKFDYSAGKQENNVILFLLVEKVLIIWPFCDTFNIFSRPI